MFVKLLRLEERAIAPLRRIGQHQFRAVRLEQRLALDTGVGRHEQLDVVTAPRADHGVGDAGVAAGGVEDGALVIQLAQTLAVQDHVQRRTVLHRPAQVEILRFGVELDPRQPRRDPVQLQQRRIADGLEQRLGVRAGERFRGQRVGHEHPIG